MKKYYLIIIHETEQQNLIKKAKTHKNMSIFTGNDICLGHYKTKLDNYIFVFINNEEKYKYEIIVPKEHIKQFKKDYPQVNMNRKYIKDD